METNQNFIWCCVANITREPHTEGSDELQLGTKRFSPGTKIYCFPQQWGDGLERIQVLGKGRKTSRLIDVVVSSKYLVNARVLKVFQPHVIRMMNGYCDNSDTAKDMADGIMKRIN